MLTTLLLYHRLAKMSMVFSVKSGILDKITFFLRFLAIFAIMGVALILFGGYGETIKYGK